MLVFTEGGKPENPEKIPRGTGENNISNVREDSDAVPAAKVQAESGINGEGRLFTHVHHRPCYANFQNYATGFFD